MHQFFVFLFLERTLLQIHKICQKDNPSFKKKKFFAAFKIWHLIKSNIEELLGSTIQKDGHHRILSTAQFNVMKTDGRQSLHLDCLFYDFRSYGRQQFMNISCSWLNFKSLFYPVGLKKTLDFRVMNSCFLLYSIIMQGVESFFIHWSH